jgi:hypothetical protein
MAVLEREEEGKETRRRIERKIREGDRIGRIEEGVVRVESGQKRDREEVEVCCWLADEFSATLEASQQCMI